MARYKKVRLAPGEWSEVIFPEMDDYKLACCDCGLVHRMAFAAYKVTRRRKNGTFASTPLNRKQYVVAFIVQRNERATSAKRRKR